MKVSVNSWHYKLNEKFFSSGRIPRSLCTYFWATVIRSVVAMTLAGFVLMIIAMIGIPVYTVVHNYFSTLPYDPNAVPGIIDVIGLVFFGVITGAIVGTIAVGIVAGIVWLIENRNRLFKYIRTDKFEVVQTKVSENILVQFLKAKKQKVCPIIQVDYSYKPSILDKIKAKLKRS